MLDLSPLWISLRIAAIATVLTFFLGLAAAQFMHHYRGRGRSVLDSLFLAPLVLPPTVLGFLLLLLLGKNGPFGILLGAVGGRVIFTWYAAIITATVVSFPLMYKTVLGALDQIDSNLQQAARTLGASKLKLFWRITLPLALPGVMAGTTLAFARALGEFGATLMLAGNIPGKTQTLPMAIYFAVEAGAFREAAIWTGVMLAIALGGLVLVNRESKRGARKQGSRGSAFSMPELRRASSLFFADSSPASQLSPSPRSHNPASPSYLSVTLTKQLPGFTLDVSFSTDHQPLGLLGASGAGKSLILQCIAGTETPDAGRIVLNGRILFDSQQGINLPSRDRRVGVLFQNYALFPHLTVAQNIAFGLPKDLSKWQHRQIIETQLARVQLQGMGDRFPAQLSGGQQQRVAIARLLASQPEMLLLDEPFSALDTHLHYLIERDLRLWLEHYPGVTLFVTHNVEEAYRICSTLLVMDRGRISTHDTKYQVLEHPTTVSAARLTGCKNISRAVPVSSTAVHALDWNCTLEVAEPIPVTMTHIGMRAHQFRFLEAASRIERDEKNITKGSKTKLQDLETITTIGERSQDVTLHSLNSTRTHSLAANTFSCWLTSTSETPHRMTLYLQLKEPPAHFQDYHLQAEVFKDKWAILKSMPFPWLVVIQPERLMLLSNRS